MTFYLGRQQPHELDDRGRLFLLGFLALIYLALSNLPVGGIGGYSGLERLIHLMDYSIPLILVVYVLAYVFLALAFTLGWELTDDRRLLVRNLLWIGVITLGLVPIAGTFIEGRTNLMFTFIQLMFGTLFLMYLSEKIWPYGLGFGVEFFIAVGVAQMMAAYLLNLGRGGEFLGLVSGILFPLAALIFTTCLFMWLVVDYHKKFSKNDDAPHLLCILLPVYLGFAFFRVIMAFSGVYGNLAGILEPVNWQRLALPINLLKVFGYTITILGGILLFTLVITLVWRIINVGRPLSPRHLIEAASASAKAGLAVTFADLLGVIHPNSLLLSIGVTYLIYKSLKTGAESLRLVVTGVIAVGVSGYILDQLMVWLTYSQPLFSTILGALIILLTLWYTLGPNNIFRQLKKHPTQREHRLH